MNKAKQTVKTHPKNTINGDGYNIPLAPLQVFVVVFFLLFVVRTAEMSPAAALWTLYAYATP